LGFAYWGSEPAKAESRPPYQGSVIASLLGAPATLDPVEARTFADLSLVVLLFDTLYRLDTSGQVVRHLAAAMPRVSSDGKVARIALISGVQFHSGALLTAEDVVASLERARRAGSWALAPVVAVHGEGNDVVVVLRRPTPELAQLLATPATSVTRAGKAPRDMQADGTGPFRLRAFRRKAREVRLQRFELHFSGPPYLKTLALRWYESSDGEARAYESGDSHISLRGDVAFAGHQPKYATRVTEGPATLLVYVGFGAAHAELTTNADFRRAVSLGLGRSSLRNIGTGEQVVPSVQPVPPDLGGPAIAPRDSQPQEKLARAALGRAAGRVSALKKPSALTLDAIVDVSRPDDREVAEKISAALFKLGLSVRVVELAPADFADRVRSGRCDFYIGQLAASSADPTLELVAAFAAGGDAWARQRMAREPLTLDDGLRVFADRLPLVPLFHRSVRVHHRDDVRGVAFDSASRLSFPDLFLFGNPGRTAEP
jgi:ABC-type transport system substrate-binding protein